MYYFTGAYIKKYINIMKFDTKRVVVALICSVSVFGMNNIWSSDIMQTLLMILNMIY